MFPRGYVNLEPRSGHYGSALIAISGPPTRVALKPGAVCFALQSRVRARHRVTLNVIQCERYPMAMAVSVAVAMAMKAKI